MATISYKVLGQIVPTAATLTTLYTVPASTQSICSTLSVCNQAASSANIRIAIRPAGAALNSKHYIVFDQPVSPYDSLVLSIGLTLATTDIVSIQSSNATTSFNLFGSEIV